MAAPFAASCLGLRADGVPNTADKDSRASVAIARGILEALDAAVSPDLPRDCGATLEQEVEAFLSVELPRLDPTRRWDVTRKTVISDFRQYNHLARVQGLIRSDQTGTLEVEIGGDYLIAPDVTVGLHLTGGGLPFLHAAISCKWSIRSDRVQNVRHEAVILTRHRRGRQPHIVTVTAEPLPTRLAAIAKGTGEVDAVYHITLPELVEATMEFGTAEQQHALFQLTEQDRLLDFAHLAATLAV